MFGKISSITKNGNNNTNNDKITNQQQITQVYKSKPIQKVQKAANKNINKNKKKQFDRKSLQGSKFRILNQLLYTRPSSQAAQYFKDHEQDFETYHQGFRQQASKWSQNPLNTIISYLKKHYSNKNKLILDLGCGQAQLQQQIQQYAKVRSFDLVAKKQFVQTADIAHLPVAKSSVDACVFCLSLMGVNYIEFLEEAKRVLKQNGQLLIAEVESRSRQWNNFIKMVESLGFQCKANKTNNYFRLLYFFVNQTKKDKLKIEGQFKDIKQYSSQILGPCIYKKR